jgi:DNA gyrase inhibitor GyrI
MVSRLANAWSRFMGEWLLASDERVAASPSFEIDLNDSATTPAAELRTLMCVPLA